MTSPSTLLRRVINPRILELGAYRVEPSVGMVKLDAMENPYRWPAELVQEWTALLAEVELNRYPDPDPAPLKHALADYAGLPAGMDVLLGNGSDEIIQILQVACAGAERTILAPEPGFVMYQLVARGLGLQYVGVPLREDFSLATEAMLDAIARHRPVLIFLAYPNNPTANLFDERGIEQIIRAAPGLVVVDEAYGPFAGATLMPWLERFPNLLLLRTLSKMGLAGLRLGYLAGAPQWLEQLNKVRLPYNVGALAQATALFVLRHTDLFEAQAAQICRSRSWLIEELQAIDRLVVYPSQANFVLFRTAAGAALRIHGELKRAGVLIKLLSGGSSLLTDCLRVTVGSEEENRVFLAALRKAV